MCVCVCVYECVYKLKYVYKVGITLDRHEYLPVKIFHHLQKDKQRKQRHSLCKVGKKRRKSSKRNHYIISPR